MKSVLLVPRRWTLLSVARPALLSLASATTLAAQAPISLVAGVSDSQGNSHIVNDGRCITGSSLCFTGPAPTGVLGGTAYDAANGVHWHTNGTMIESSLVNFPCDFYCQQISPVPNTSGLAFDVRVQDLWFLTTTPELVRTTVAGLNCPQIQSRFPLAAAIPTGAVSAGLALSVKRDLIFYSASTVGATPTNVVLVAALSNPNVPICTLDFGAAFGVPQADPITGLAYDECADELFAVAGASFASARVSFPACTLQSIASCTPGTVRHHGLCFEPPHPRFTGRQCLTAGCLNCGPRIYLNDPALGNRSFYIAILYAHTGSLATVFVSPGGCTSGIPALCGTFHPSLALAPIALPPMTLSGPSSCTGSAVWPAPIPASAELCGARLCVQGVIACPTGGFGLTAAANLVIG